MWQRDTKQVCGEARKREGTEGQRSRWVGKWLFGISKNTVFALVRHAEVGGGSGGGALGIERVTHQRATARRLVRTSAPRGRLHVAPYRSADRRLARGTVCRGEKIFLALVLDFGKPSFWDVPIPCVVGKDEQARQAEEVPSCL